MSFFSSPIISLAKPLPFLLFPLLDQPQIQNCTVNCLLNISTWTFNKHLQLNVFGVGCFISPQTCSPTSLPHLSEWQLHSPNWLEKKHESSFNAALPLSCLITISSTDHHSVIFKICSEHDHFHYSKQVQATISISPCLDYCNSLLTASTVLSPMSSTISFPHSRVSFWKHLNWSMSYLELKTL